MPSMQSPGTENSPCPDAVLPSNPEHLTHLQAGAVKGSNVPQGHTANMSRAGDPGPVLLDSAPSTPPFPSASLSQKESRTGEMRRGRGTVTKEITPRV